MTRTRRSDRLAVLSFVLIVPAIVAFAIGLFASGLVFLYVSLALSVLAGLALGWSGRVRARGPRATDAPIAAEEPISADAPDAPEAGPETAAVDVAELTAASDEDDELRAFMPGAAEAVEEEPAPEPAPEPELEPDREPEPAAEPEPVGAAPAPAQPAAPRPSRTRRRRVAPPPPKPPPAPPQSDLGPLFPIEDYPQLTAKEIVKVLSLLDREELDMVRAYEAKHAARREVLTRIDRMLARGGPI